MTDQTRWGIDLVQQQNKQKAYEDQKDMREELKKFILNCSVYNLQKMYEKMKEMMANMGQSGGETEAPPTDNVVHPDIEEVD